MLCDILCRDVQKGTWSERNRVKLPTGCGHKMHGRGGGTSPCIFFSCHKVSFTCCRTRSLPGILIHFHIKSKPTVQSSGACQPPFTTPLRPVHSPAPHRGGHTCTLPMCSPHPQCPPLFPSAHPALKIHLFDIPLITLLYIHQNPMQPW